MPVTAVSQGLLERIAAMQRQLDEVSRAVGRPSDQIRDVNDNVIHMVPGAANPVLGAKNQDVSVSLVAGTVAVTDGQGRDARPISASNFNGPVTGDTTGVHHGEVGTPTELHNHYGDLHGNAYGFHYGPVGDGATQNQINCLNIYHTGAYGTVHGEVGVPGDLWNAYITVRGKCFAEVGQAGGPFFTTYGDVGNATNFFNLHGTVYAPSARNLKTDEKPLLAEAGTIVDGVPSATWRWDPTLKHNDDELHAGPMADDIAKAAPWLIRQSHNPGAALMLSDRDLIGVLWGALREARQRIAVLEGKPKP
jgi:hypothetical protein